MVVPGKTVGCVVLRGKPGLPVNVPGRGNALGKGSGLVEVAGPYNRGSRVTEKGIRRHILIQMFKHKALLPTQRFHFIFKKNQHLHFNGIQG